MGQTTEPTIRDLVREYDLTVAGRRLREWRLNQPPGRHVAAAELARRIGVSRTRIQQLERGTATGGPYKGARIGCGVQQRARIAAAMGVPVNAIWPDAPEVIDRNPSEVPPHREEPTP